MAQQASETRSMHGPHFCSMKITQDVRDYAAKHGISEETAAEIYRRPDRVWSAGSASGNTTWPGA